MAKSATHLLLPDHMAAALRPACAGKHVLITGGGRSLGASLVALFASLGAHVTATARDKAQLDALESQGVTLADKIVLDLSDVEAVEALTVAWVAQKRPLDILVNNAATWMTGKLETQTTASIVSLLTANLAGTLILTRGLLSTLRASPAADIVNLISVSGMTNAPLQGGSATYLASKHGQAGFTDALRQELWGETIRLTAIYPPRILDISPFDAAEWNKTRGNAATINNRDVAITILLALTRARHVSFQSIALESANSNFYAHTPLETDE